MFSQFSHTILLHNSPTQFFHAVFPCNIPAQWSHTCAALICTVTLQCIPQYTTKTDLHTSVQTVYLFHLFFIKFILLFSRGACREQSLDSLSSWLKKLPTYGCHLVACGSESLSNVQVRAVEEAVDDFKKKNLPVKRLPGIRVDPRHIFRVSLHILRLS